MRFTTAFIFALAAAGLGACDANDPTGPAEPTDVTAAPSTAMDADQAGAAADSTAAVGSPSLSLTRVPRSFFINPISGNNTNAGTKLKPFKTLARGLSTAIAGDTMRLAAGLYSAATNGEKFTSSAQQVVVPAGVMILGTVADAATSQLKGGAGETGLNLKGDATVRNLIVKGFSTGIRATQGVQSLKSLLLQNNHGLDLTGSARATLVSSSVQLTSPELGNPVGALVQQQAQLTVVGGTITFGGQNCVTSTIGLHLSGAARLTMKNGATIKDIAGAALTMLGTSKAMLTGATTVDRNLSAFPGCTPIASVLTNDSTTLTLKKARVFSTGGSTADGISWTSRGLLTLDSAEVKGHTGAGIRTFLAKARIVVSGTLFLGNSFGIEAGSAKEVNLTITGSTVSKNVVGIQSPFFKLRGSNIALNKFGILVTSPFTDLGQRTDPGHNTIINNSSTGVTFSQSVINGGVGGIFGSGNIWNPLTQGSDAGGRYATQVLDGASPLASGTNFKLPGFNFAIEF